MDLLDIDRMGFTSNQRDDPGETCAVIGGVLFGILLRPRIPFTGDIDRKDFTLFI